MLPKLIATDIDGVWTDGGMFYTESGDEFKKYNTYDSAGIVFSQMLGIPVIIITGENCVSVQNRAKKLKIEHCFVGVSNKIELLIKYCEKHGIALDEVAYIGDDINDIKVFQAVGFSACPSSAPEYIKKIVDRVMTKKGGEGVFREFVELILHENGILQSFLEKNYSLSK